MDKTFQNTLLNISDELCKKEVSAMIFLCGKNLKQAEKETIRDGTALLSIMQKKGFLSQDNLLFLKELLSRIGRNDILKNELKTTKAEVGELERSFQHISAYRSLLYDISGNLSSEETEKIMFLLENKIKHICKLNEAKCMMDVLSEMEKQSKLSEDDLQTLNTYLVDIGRSDLSDKLKKFETEQYNRRLDFDTKFEKMSIQEGSGGDVNVSSIQPNTQNNPSLTDNQLEEYKLDKIPHGWCIIVNNQDFHQARLKNQNIYDRTGSQKDAEEINRVFSSRGYKVKPHHDLTGEKMKNIMEAYAKKDHTEKDSFVCFVLSHGSKGTVCGTDGIDVSVKDLTDLFNGLNCPSLVGKPKVFFIQACQGDKHDKGVPYVSDSSASVYVNDATAQNLPITADFFTAFASVEEYVSFRSPTDGSVYIQNLCTILKDHQFFKTDLTGILTKVHEKIADEIYQFKKNGKKLYVKQMPTYQSELRKRLILPPPSNGQQASLLPHV